jgi:O-acetylhomoserine/O-acetylserine sulfhydrylase-like pyridoxal-dependent enzyme
MTEAVVIALIAAFTSIITAFITSFVLYQTVRVESAINRTHDLVNSRMTELLLSTATIARASGIAAGQLRAEKNVEKVGDDVTG